MSGLQQLNRETLKQVAKRVFGVPTAGMSRNYTKARIIENIREEVRNNPGYYIPQWEQEVVRNPMTITHHDLTELRIAPRLQSQWSRPQLMENLRFFFGVHPYARDSLATLRKKYEDAFNASRVNMETYHRQEEEGVERTFNYLSLYYAIDNFITRPIHGERNNLSPLTDASDPAGIRHRPNRDKEITIRLPGNGQAQFNPEHSYFVNIRGNDAFKILRLTFENFDFALHEVVDRAMSAVNMITNLPEQLRQLARENREIIRIDNPNDYEVRMSAKAVLNVGTVLGEEVSNFRIFNARSMDVFYFPLNANSTFEEIYDHIAFWMSEIHELIQKIVKSSKDYAFIYEVESLTFFIKLVQRRGNGKVVLNDNGKFKKRIYNPEVEHDCFRRCLLYGSCKLTQEGEKILKGCPTTLAKLRTIARERHVTTIKSRKQVRFLVHIPSSINGSFSEDKGGKVSRFPTEVDNDCFDLHIGFAKSHFFLILDTTVLKELNENMFERSDLFEDSLLPALNSPLDDKAQVYALKYTSAVTSSSKPWMKRAYFWDMETFREGTEAFSEMMVYSVGVREPSGEVKIFYGLNALDEFVDYILNLANTLTREFLDEWGEIESKLLRTRGGKTENSAFNQEKFSRKRKLADQLKCIFYAHNASGFDNHFLFKHAKMRFSKLIDAHGLLQMIEYGGLIEFRDTIRMMPSSLDSLCKSFGLDEANRKKEFPHDFASKDTLYYVGEVPAAHYWPKGVIPSEHLDKPFDFRAVSQEYQKLDVVSLAKVWDAFSTRMHQETHRSTRDFITLPSTAYNYVMHSAMSMSEYEETNKEGNIEIKRDKTKAIYTCKDRKTDMWMRQAVQGGRVFPQKAEFKSVDADDYVAAIAEGDTERASQIHKNMKDYLTDYDAVSLYPSAMSLFEYPVGKPSIANESRVIWWQDQFTCLRSMLMGKYNRYKSSENRSTPDDAEKEFWKLPLAIIEAEVYFPNKNIVCPLLSSRRKSEKGDYVTYFDLKDNRTIIKTSVDIFQAMRYNDMKVTKVIRAIEWPNKSFIFRDCIKKMFNARLEAKKNKDIVSDLLYKLMMNSSYGKLTQHIRDDKIEFFNAGENDELDAKLHEGSVKIFELMNNNEQVLLHYNKARLTTPKDPVHLGAFVLSYSKVIMNRCIDSFNGFRDWDTTFYYTDTDSLHIHRSTYDMLDPALDGKNLGQLHDDIDEVIDGKIIEAYFIRPKLYADKIAGYDKNTGKPTIAYHIRAKGVKSGNIQFSDFPELLRNNHKEVDASTWQRHYKKFDEGAVVVRKGKKTINEDAWGGRVRQGNRFIPLA